MEKFDIIARALSTNNDLITSCQNDVKKALAVKNNPIIELDLEVLLDGAVEQSYDRLTLVPEQVIAAIGSSKLYYSTVIHTAKTYAFRLKQYTKPYETIPLFPSVLSSTLSYAHVFDYAGDYIVQIGFYCLASVPEASIAETCNITISFIIKPNNEITNCVVTTIPLAKETDINNRFNTIDNKFDTINATIEENELVVSNALNDLNERTVLLENIDASTAIVNLNNQITTMQQTITELQAEIATMKTELNKTLIIE